MTGPKRALYWLPLVAALLLSACGHQAAPKLRPLAADAVILAFGDSLTHGTGAKADESYPAVLAHLSGHKVINAGVPGELTPQGAERLPALLDRYHPALLVLCEGGNDLLRKVPPEEIEASLRRMLDAAKQRNVQVVLLGVPEPTLMFREPAPFYAHLAKAYGIPYDGATLASIESDPARKSDKIHPNAKGYADLAQGVFALLQKSGALPASH